MTEPNANTIQIGMWNASIASDYEKISSFNREPIQVTGDQIKHLYLLLYPLVASEFVHRSDLENWAETIMQQFQEKIEDLNKQLSQQKQDLDSHTHLGNMGSPTSPPTIAPAQPVSGFTLPKLEMWNSKPEDDEFKFGESIIIRAIDATPSLQQRDVKSSAGQTKNTADEFKIENQIADGQYLHPFDVEDDNINEPNTFSK
jgi:hypothetical protein